MQFASVDREALHRYRAWKRIVRRPTLPITRQLTLDQSSQVMAIGSCFVNEIRAVLESSDLVVHPLVDSRLGELFVDEVKSNPAWGDWDERVHYQCFTPFTIRQEVEVAFGVRNHDPDAVLLRRYKGRDVFVDPYRRSVFAASRDDVLAIRDRMTQQFLRGLNESDLIVMTLGLTEAFRMPRYDLFVSEYNGIIGDDELELVDGTYDQVLAALGETIDLIRSRFPSKPIVLTVSPIPMARTFSESDAVTATMRAKSMLRTAVDSLRQSATNIHYWPSYEYVMYSHGSFCSEDLRHVRRETVREITTAFCNAFFDAKTAARVARGNPIDTPSSAPVQNAFSKLRSTFRRSA